MLNLHVACNDPANGIFTYQAEILNIVGASRDMECELEPTNWRRAPRFVDLGDSIRLSGKTWPIVGGKEYVGNWCWNSYLIGNGRKTTNWWMVDFMIWLRGRGTFRMTTGPTDLFNWFNREVNDARPVEVHKWLGELD